MGKDVNSARTVGDGGQIFVPIQPSRAKHSTDTCRRRHLDTRADRLTEQSGKTDSQPRQQMSTHKYISHHSSDAETAPSTQRHASQKPASRLSPYLHAYKRTRPPTRCIFTHEPNRHHNRHENPSTTLWRKKINHLLLR